MSLRLGSHRVFVSQGLALAALAVASACSSGGSNVVQDEAGNGGSSGGSGSGSSSSANTSSGSTSSSGTSSSSGAGTSSSSSSSGGGGTDAQFMVETSADGGCPAETSVTEATKITFTVGWPSSTAGNAGTGPISIWLLTHFMTVTNAGTGQMLSGTSQSCGTTLPDLQLNSTGMAATGGGTKLNIQLLNTTWDKVTRTFPTTATQTGWNTGDTQTTNPALGLLGLPSSGSYNSDTAAWPPVCATGMCASSPPVSCTGGTCSGMYAGSFAGSAVTDDDGDGNPGITAYPSTASGYALPPTSALFAQVADEVYIVSRNEIAITGKDMNCATGTGTGTANITLFDNHVVGCHVTSLHGTAGPCTSDQAGFLDSNRTIYGYDQTMGDAISKAHPVMGTASIVRLVSTATCADARAALP
jgi:hypothetical protein